MSRRLTLVIACGAILAVPLAGCGGDDDGSGSSAPGNGSPVSDNGSPTVGFMQTPAPKIGRVSLPDLSNGDSPFRFRAETDKLLLVFFGYSNCPDICPGTMSNIKFALARLGERATDVDVAMVTVDPNRDLTALPAYVKAYVPGGHALGTDDPVRLQKAADAFGVTYTVQELPGGKADVGHTSSLYAVDDNGQLVITWIFGVSPTDLTNDLTYLLDHRVR